MKESIKPGAGRKRKSVARGTGLPASLKAVHLNAAGPSLPMTVRQSGWHNLL